MNPRMKPPVHCEVCGDSSKYMNNVDADVLEDYGTCFRCMSGKMMDALMPLQVVSDRLSYLADVYPPLSDMIGSIEVHLDKLMQA